MIQRSNGRRYIIMGMIITVLVLLVGLFLLTRTGGGSSTTNTAQATATKPVVVALVSIPQGTVFKEGQPLNTFFTVKQMPANLKPFGAYSSIQQIAAFAASTGCLPKTQPDCIGQITTTETIYQNVPVVSGMFTSLGLYRQTVGPSFRVPPGYVAISLDLGGANAVAGSIQAGDTVDLMASYTGAAASLGIHAQPQTQYIMSNVKVIGVGTFAAPGQTQAATAGGTLVILARFQQALVIQHLKDFGWELSAVLRSAKETGISNFKTLPVTDRWFFVKNSNPFKENPGY